MSAHVEAVSTRSKIGRFFLVLVAVFAVWIGLIFAAAAVVDSRVPVKLPMKGVATSMWDEGYVEARGTWTIEDDKMASPIQTSKITCYKPSGECRDARAEIFMKNTLTADTEVFTIAKWDQHTIVYTSDSPVCARYVYTIDRAAETVSGVRLRVKSDDAMCKELKERLVLHLVDGLALTRKAEEEATPWWGDLAFAPLKLIFH